MKSSATAAATTRATWNATATTWEHTTTKETAVPGPGRAISSRNNQHDARTAPSPQPSSG
eukprot:8122408-Alexandrium_andersonii.AAC.1